MIEISNLSKSYGDIKVLDNINISIEEGSIFGIMGYSGAGKSTLLRCINGLDIYDSGNLKINGIEVKSLSKKELQIFRKDIAMIFQHFPLLNRKTAYKNIEFPMKCWGVKKDDIDFRIKHISGITGISDLLHKKPQELSGGEKQRVAIARALCMDPKILLCDEATSALDPSTTDDILNLLQRINRDLGITIVLVTHQLEVIRKVCDKAIIISKGKIISKGNVEDIFLNPNLETKKFLGEKTIDIDNFFTIKLILNNDYSKEVLSRMANELNVSFFISDSNMEQYKDRHMGYIVLKFYKSDKEDVIDFFSKEKVFWEEY